MANDQPQAATGSVPYGDVDRKVGIEVLRQQGINVEELVQKLVDNAAAEFASTYYYYSILRMYLAGHEDYKEICEDARLEDRQHYELILPRIYELGGSLPYSLHEFADRAGCPAAYLPGTDNGRHSPTEEPSAADILTVLLESERCAIRSWLEICQICTGKDPRTYDLAARILNEETEHEAWFIELLALERDGNVRPSGHFRRGFPGEAPYSRNRQFSHGGL